MMKTRLAVFLAVGAIVVACAEGAPPVPKESKSHSATDVAALRVEVPVATQGGVPLLVGAGGGVKWHFAAPKSGSVLGVGVQVGNFGGSSDGVLAIRLCRGPACVEGSGDLSESVDNEYMMVSLSSSLDVSKQDGLDVIVTRVGGTGQFAVWTYPGDSLLVAPDGSEMAKSMKMALNFRF